MGEMEASTFIPLTIVVGALAFLIWEAVNTPFFNIWALVAPGLLMLEYLNYRYEWTGAVLRNPNFFFADGVNGTIAGPATRVAGARVTFPVAVSGRYAGDQSERLRGFRGLKNKFTGTRLIMVTDDASQFFEVPMQYRGAPEGAVFYRKSVQRQQVPNPFEINIKEVERLRSIAVEAQTALEAATSSARQLNRHDQANLDQAASRVRGITQIMDARKSAMLKSSEDLIDKSGGA